MRTQKKYFHLEKVFSNRDVYGNVYSFIIITCNKNGETLVCYDQGRNGAHFMRKFFNDFGFWTETERWESIRDFNRELKYLEKSTNLYLREETISGWLKRNHRIRKVKNHV
jgi:hypothetical protein